MGEDHAQVRELRGELKAKLEALREGYFNASAIDGMPINDKITQRRELKGHFQKVYSIHWAGRGSEVIVSASQDGKLIVWNALTTNKLNAIPLKSCWVMSCAFEQKNNELVASGGLDNVCSVYRLGDHEPGTTVRPDGELEGHLGYISCCRFMDEGRIVTASGDSFCRVWDVVNGVCLYYFKEHMGDVMSVSPHPTLKDVFISGSVDLECKLWDIRQQGSVATFKSKQQEKPARGRFNLGFDEEEMEGQEVGSSMFYAGHESDVNSVAFFPDGFSFGSGSDDATCRLWDLRAHQELNVFKHQTVLCGITSVEFSKSGRILFGGYDDHNLLAWDVLRNPIGDAEESEPVTSWKSHGARVSSISVQSDGKALATASWDTVIKIHA